jgi:hypothetical protein
MNIKFLRHTGANLKKTSYLNVLQNLLGCYVLALRSTEVMFNAIGLDDIYHIQQISILIKFTRLKGS